MILVGPLGILKVSSDSIGGDLLKPLGMIEKTEVLAHLSMTEIVPVAKMG